MGLFDKIIQQHKRIFCEYYEVEAGDSITMSLQLISELQVGSKLYELDGIQFYQADVEDLDNAVSICIDEEFMPHWQDVGVEGYVIENIDEENGLVDISIY